MNQERIDHLTKVETGDGASRVSRRLWVALMLALSMLVVPTTGVAQGNSAHAQEASPPADGEGFPESVELAPGVVADSIVFVDGIGENPALYRLHIDAGVAWPVAPGPDLQLIYMETGRLTFTLDSAVTLGQLGDTQAQGEAVPANTEFVLGTGQYMVMQPGVSGEARNDGEGTATASVAGLTPAGVIVPAATPAG